MALNTLRQAIEDFPDVENFKQTLALALFDLKMYDKAENRCREILARDPRNTRVLILLGEIREKQDRPAGRARVLFPGAGHRAAERFAAHQVRRAADHPETIRAGGGRL